MATKKPARKAAARKSGSTQSSLYMDKETYKRCIEGLTAQGLDQKDAVATLSVGLREANGRPVPLEFRASTPVPVSKPLEAELEPA